MSAKAHKSPGSPGWDTHPSLEGIKRARCSPFSASLTNRKEYLLIKGHQYLLGYVIKVTNVQLLLWLERKQRTGPTKRGGGKRNGRSRNAASLLTSWANKFTHMRQVQGKGKSVADHFLLNHTSHSSLTPLGRRCDPRGHQTPTEQHSRVQGRACHQEGIDDRTEHPLGCR